MGLECGPCEGAFQAEPLVVNPGNTAWRFGHSTCKQCATGYPVPVPANPANIFQSGSGQILAGLAGFFKIIQKFSKMLKM